jgi:hypothetical protein
MYGAVARHAPALVPTPAPQPRALWNVDAITQRRAVREMMPEPMGRSLAGATLSASTLLALRELVLELHRRGYRVVLLQAPMHSEFLRAMRTNPGDAEREAEFQRVVRDRGLTDADTSLTIDDAAALGASDTIFVDYGHLTRAGASLQTERLATFLHRSALFAPLATAAR